MSERQTTLGYYVPATLAERIRILDEARLPQTLPAGRVNVSADKVVGFLRVVADHAGTSDWAWPGKDLIATKMRVSVDTVGRVIRAAVDAGLVVKQTRKAGGVGIVCNHYQIQWGQLERRAEPYRGHPEVDAPAQSEPIRHDDQADPSQPESIRHEADRSVMVPPPIRHGAPTDPSSCPHRSVTLPPKPPLTPRNPKKTPNAPRGGVFDCGPGDRDRHRTRSKRPRLTVDDLRSVQALEPIIAEAVRRGTILDTEPDRLAVMAWAEHCARRTQVDDRCALFVRGLFVGIAGRPWEQRASGDEEDAARRRLVEARGVVLARRESAAIVEAEEARTIDQAKRDALAALAAEIDSEGAKA